MWVADALGFGMDAPFGEIPADDRHIIHHGFDEATAQRLQEHRHWNAFLRDWAGLVPELVRRHRETKSERIRQNLERIMAEETCPGCRGMRLRPEALQFRIGGRSIGEINNLTLTDLADWIKARA